MEQSSPLLQAMPEGKRQRDVFLLYGLAFRGLPCIDNPGTPSDGFDLPSDHVPLPSKDSVLTAFAQLACTRLDARRAFISLIDNQRQHILAEATLDLYLRAGSFDRSSNPLWLGNVSIPRSWGLCEELLNIETSESNADEAVMVINDMTQSDQHRDLPYVQGGPKVRFYAGTPLISPSGTIVGALCVLDDKPRNGLLMQDVIHLKDLATTIVEYLDTYTLKDQYRRGEQLTRGLISFSEGAAALQPFQDESQHTQIAASGHVLEEHSKPQDRSPPHSYWSTSGSTFDEDTPRIEIDEADDIDEANDVVPSLRRHKSEISKPSVRTATSGYGSVRRLQESILPTDSKSMFSRAANIILASSNLDGVMILDASVAGVRDRDHGLAVDPSSETSPSSSDGSNGSRSSGSGNDSSQHRRTSRREGTNSAKSCQLLAYASSAKSPVPAPRGILERDLVRLLRKFPNGKVLNFGIEGELLSTSADDSDPSSSASLDPATTERTPKAQSAVRRLQRIYTVLRAALPDARSVTFVPLWDYERSRWFAGCLCWSNSMDRLLSPRIDLSYFKVFGHSIMTELSRLDALASNKAKTTFMASVSHELRSPLHGILGTLEFLKDTELDSFQSTMINSMSACGRTLLDTINHLLDYAKKDEVGLHVSSKKLKGTQIVRLSSKPRKVRSSSLPRFRAPALDAGIVTEEVVEAVFSGQSYTSSYDGQSEALWEPAENSSQSPSDRVVRRKTCYIVVDIACEEDWMFNIPIGPWRRIVMNIFGNALKYTDSGRILVSLAMSEPPRGTESTRTLTLTVNDSGSGIGPSFMANRMFQPFSQENSHVSGTGLGLSIVRQIIETIGGKVEVNSDPSRGTKLTVRLNLAKPENMYVRSPQRAQLLALLPHLERKRICILHRNISATPDLPELPQDTEGLAYFTNVLAKTLTQHLKMEVIQTNEWEGHNADIVICPEPSFLYLSAIRRSRRLDGRAPTTIFIAMDALEAATIRSDVRVTSKESVVEIMTQPCGPYKLASIIDRCLERFDQPEENIPSSHISMQNPRLPIHRTPGFTAEGDLTQVDYFGRFSAGAAVGSSLKHSIAQESPDAPTEIPTENLQPSTDAPQPAPENLTSAPRSEAITPEVAPIPDLEPKELNILITDDNSINRKLLVAFLKKRSIHYEEAINGLEALLSYQERPVKYDVILMDLSMPVMDGMTATRRIREYEQKHNVDPCYIIALTGLTSASARLEAWSSGVDFFMTKPVDFNELGRVIVERNVQTRKQSADS